MKSLTPFAAPPHARQGIRMPMPDRTRADAAETGRIAAVALALFVGLILVYAFSIPDHFNQIYENRRFFDSDGEFITRQFNQGKTFTHNNHLLYHIGGTVLFELTGNAVTAHKALSVFFGALGATVLFLGGYWWSRRLAPALIAALFVAGCSSYWFFSATIDTYVPHIAAASAALVAALLCLRLQRAWTYALLGACMGLGFLFRTDGFLLALLAVVVLDRRRNVWPRLVALAVSGAVVGLAFYAILANLFYDVPLRDAGLWALGHLDRPEVAGGQWGEWRNVTPASLYLTFVNHAFYAVAMPGVEATRSGDFVAEYAKLGTGAIVPALWIAAFAATLAAALWITLRHVAAGVPDRQRRERIWLFGLALLWFVPRILFYAWWDPNDPFLFACVSLPALWLLLLYAVDGEARPGPEEQPQTRGITIAAALLTAALWIHNLIFLIQPMRQASIG